MDKNNRNKISTPRSNSYLAYSCIKLLASRMMFWFDECLDSEHVPGVCTLSTHVKTKKTFGDQYFCRLLFIETHRFVARINGATTANVVETNLWHTVERSSAVECLNLNWESLDSNPLGCCFKFLEFVFLPRCHSSLSYINEYLAIGSCINVSE